MMQKRLKKPLAVFLACVLALSAFFTGPGVIAWATVGGDNVVISEVYGGGGNTGSEYKNDFIELYNPTDNDVSLEGWSVQYASAKGTTYAATALTGQIKAKGYYLIQEAAGTGGTKALPTPDATGTLALSGTKGKAALVKNTEAITGKSDADVLDFVGFGIAGTEVNEYEGAKSAPNPSNSLSIGRTDGKDTDVNGDDFKTQAPDPQNGTSGPVEPGKVASVTASPDPNTSVQSGAKVTLTCATSGATIYYQLNGSTDILTYTAPIEITADTTIKAWAEKAPMTKGDPATFAYKIESPVPVQVAAVAANPGSSMSAKVGDKVELTCATAQAQIKYKLNNDAQYRDYSGAITLSALPATITAYAVKAGMTDSAPVVFEYKEKFAGTYHIYFGQLHSHTNLSDGQGSVEDAFSYASKVANLDFLAVTDHSNSLETTAGTANIMDGSSSDKWKEGHTAASSITAQKVKKNNVSDPGSTFLGVYGYEMTWSDGAGHMNTFNTPGFENRNNAVYKNKNQSITNPIGLKTYYDQLAKVPGSISQFNHPGSTFGDFYDFANYSPVNDSLINLVEVGNGEGAIGSNGYFPSYEYYTRALDKGWHVAPTNNQDNHKGKWGDANTARSVILAPELTEQSLYDAMRSHHVYATEDNDLSISYSLNDAVMGSEISVSKGEKIHLKADISDPTDSQIGKVEVIVNGGRVAAVGTLNAKNGTISFDLNNNYSYYYLRITQPDKDTAVTAPVWTSQVDKAGISKTTADTELPVKGESVNITTALYNNENSTMQVSSLEYRVNGAIVKSVSGSDLDGGNEVAPLATKQYSFAYTPPTAGNITVDVTMKATLGGIEKTYTDVLHLNVADPATVTKVLVDGTHFNDYVNGYYSGNMVNFAQIAANSGIQVRIETNAITKEMLDDTDLLLVSAPLKYVGKNTPAGAAPAVFSSEFQTLVSNYVNNGGTVITCGLADYQDDKNGDPYTSSTQINNLLKAIGAKTTINSDEVVDQENNDGSQYRLKLTNYNKNSQWLSGVTDGQTYSLYSGCSVNPGSGAEWLINGFDSTYSINSKMTNSQYEHTNIPSSLATDPYNEAKAVIKKGKLCALATEKVGAGRVFVGGTVFVSNFEVKAELDNQYDKQYINYTILMNILNSVKVNIPTTTIENVRKNGKPGDVFAVEGIVTAGSEQPNAFFDAIYIQDATGGINIFPVANGSKIKVGQKLRVVGHVDEFQGEKELKIGSGVEYYKVIDSDVHPVAPLKVSAADSMNYDKNGGRLVQVTGTVSNIKTVNGIIDSFYVKDGTNDNGARVFIDGYINPGVDLSAIVKEGASVSAVGVVYQNPDGVCLRVRDRNEIVKVSTGSSSESSGTTPSSSTPPAASDASSQPGDHNSPATGETGMLAPVVTLAALSSIAVFLLKRKRKMIK